MSHLDNATFDRNANVVELSFGEIDEVNGGGIGIGIAVAVVVVGLLAVGFAGEHNRDNDDNQKSD